MLQFKPQKKLNKKLVLGRGAGGYPDRLGSEKILVCTYQMIIKILNSFLRVCVNHFLIEREVRFRNSLI